MGQWFGLPVGYTSEDSRFFVDVEADVNRLSGVWGSDGDCVKVKKKDSRCERRHS
jgi:hypothetical protein